MVVCDLRFEGGEGVYYLKIGVKGVLGIEDSKCIGFKVVLFGN